MLLENLLGTVSVVQLVKRTINAALGDVATQTWPRDYETFFMLNSAEHEICHANKSQITSNCRFFLIKHS